MLVYIQLAANNVDECCHVHMQPSLIKSPSRNHGGLYDARYTKTTYKSQHETIGLYGLMFINL